MAESGIDCEIDDANNVVYTRVTGDVQSQQVVEKLSSLINDPSYRPGLNGLVDLRRSTTHSSTEDVRHIAELLIASRERIGQSRTAIVVADELAFGLTRMFEAYAEDSSINTRIFWNMDEAYDWLAENTGQEEA